MACGRGKAIRLVCMGLYFFLSGVEYAVILPTLNGFLLSLHSDTLFLGIILASFSITGLISAPIYGRITDRTGSTKACVILGNVFEIVGNFMYLISSNPYMIWGSRLIAGAGSGAASSILGTISRTTTVEERTAAFSQLMALRQIGLLIGPAFNVFLTNMNFYLGPFKVDQFTSPGLMMVLLWILHTLLVIFFYKDVPVTLPEMKQDPVRSANSQYEEIGTEKGIIHARMYSVTSGKPLRTFMREFLREEVMVCLAITFMMMFAQTGLETVVTPLTSLFFKWNGLENSFLFCGAGVVVIVGFISLIFISKKLSDRLLILIGCIVMTASYILFLVYVIVLNQSFDTDMPQWLLPVFCVHLAILTISLPYVWVPQASLFSKVTSEETQAFNQGIRLSAMGFGQILGPIWASSMAIRSRLPIMVSVDLALISMITLMVCMSYKRLVSPAEVSSSVSILDESESENTPLLQSGQNHSINA